MRLYRRIAILLSLALLTVVTVTVTATAATTPSPAMMAQFKKLPKSEQARLAKQYGLATPNAGSSTREINPEVSMAEPEITEMAATPNTYSQSYAPKKSDRFGLDMFQGENRSLTEDRQINVPDSYVVGPMDEFTLHTYGKESGTQQITVGRDGSLAVEGVGSVYVAGMTFENAKKLIIAEVKRRILGVEVNLTMTKLRTISVLLAGEVNKPGTYQIPALSTVTDLLMVSGGISQIGTLRDIRVSRDGKQLANYDLYNLLLRGDSSGDVRLQQGDVVFVPAYSSLVEVKGEVLRPMFYEVQSGETVSTLLKMAGGVTAQGYKSKATIARIDSVGNRVMSNLDLTSQGDLGKELRNGDLLTVGTVSNRTLDQVVLLGAVARPNAYAYHEGMRINDLVSSLWGDLQLNADLDYALVISRNSNSNRLKIRSFNVANALNQPGSEDNLQLSSQDTVLILPYDNMADRQELDAYLYQRFESQLTGRVRNGVSSTQDNLPAVANYLSTLEANFSKSAFSLVNAEDTLREQNYPELRKFQNPSLPLDIASIPEDKKSIITNGYRQFLLQLPTSPEYWKFSHQLGRSELLYGLMKTIEQNIGVDGSFQLVSVVGDVKAPGNYPLAENTTVKSLVAAAGGLLPSAFLGNAELTKSLVGADGSVSVAHKNISLSEELAGQSVTRLHSRDTLNVFRYSGWSEEKEIKIAGEVRFPGQYRVKAGEKLSDVIQRAGGLTENAFVEGAIYTRQGVKLQELTQSRSLIQQLRKDIAARTLSADDAPVGMEDTLLMLNEIDKQEPIGRIVIDLKGIQNGDETANLTIEKGDFLFVPAKRNYVTVVGEVQHPSSHRFKAGLAIQDYLSLAGGTRSRADNERVYVIRADGSVYVPVNNSWFAVEEGKMQAGDTIVVPLDTEYKDTMNVWTQVTQIFYQSAVALAAINSF